MTDEPALIASCIADPVDDTRHLVLADWWDEHGDERQRARAEWIRLTCSTGRKWRGGIRQSGEPKWIRENAHRIWPELAKLCSKRVSGPHNIPFLRLLHRLIIVPVPRQSTANPQKFVGYTNIRIHACRGITESVTIPFQRAAWLGPIVARDEPYVQLEIATKSQMGWYPKNGPDLDSIRDAHITVSDKPFRTGGMIDVWDRITGHQSTTGYNDGGTHKIFIFPDADLNFEIFCRGLVTDKINIAFTEWARGRAYAPPPGKSLGETFDE